MSTAVTFIVGFLIGLVTAGVIAVLIQRQRRGVLDEQIRDAFAALSRDALSMNSSEFLKLAKSSLETQTTQGVAALENEKKLIDASLEDIRGKLTSLNSMVQSVEKERAESFGKLSSQLKANTEANAQLQMTTAKLREALASPQRRGQWGERMADDVLRLAGFIEGVNYYRQKQFEGSRPDYTFLLPGDQCVNMDVKFPLDNYLRVLDAEDDEKRRASTEQFLRDVRARIREVTNRGYIDTKNGTVDYMLVFIPNEQIYGFIHEQAPDLLDDAIRSKVVLCSPLTLYAILAVIRQAVENFRFAQNSQRILDLLAKFKDEWGKYATTMEKMGRKIEEASSAYGELTGVRTRKLERQLDKIEDLQRDEPTAGQSTSHDSADPEPLLDAR